MSCNAVTAPATSTAGRGDARPQSCTSQRARLRGPAAPVRAIAQRGCSAYLGLCCRRCCAHLLPGHYGSSLPARCLHCHGSQTPSWDGRAPRRALWDTAERGCLAGKEAEGPDPKGPSTSLTHRCYPGDNGPPPCSQWQPSGKAHTEGQLLTLSCLLLSSWRAFGPRR